MLRWKKLWWWQDVMGGYQAIAPDGSIFCQVYKDGGAWLDHQRKQWATFALAKASVQDAYMRQLNADLTFNLENWYREQNKEHR